MSEIPLTKLANIAHDLTRLAEELVVVNRYFTTADPQHESRKWEYALALHARRAWLQWDYEYRGHADRTHGGRIVDVGGWGSPFAAMLDKDAGAPARVVDPKGTDGQALSQYIRYACLASEVYCLSVLEHVDDLDRFCYHLGCLVAPGGLLFLTMDYGTDLPDQYHFHWDRKRIFDTKAWETLREKIGTDFELFGTRDRTYHGNQVYDFSIASLALVKRA